MSSVVADTHAAVWYLAEPERLSKPAKEAMHQAARQGRPTRGVRSTSRPSRLSSSSIVEKARLTEAVHERVRQALRDPASVLRLAPMDLLLVTALQAIPRESVPDMPDRIVAATAKRLELPLISRDRKIQLADVDTIW